MNFVYPTLVVLVVLVVVFVVISLWRRLNPPRVGTPPGPTPPGPPPTNPVTRELYVADGGDNAIWIFGVADVASTLVLPPLRFIRGGPLGEVGDTQLRYPLDLAVDSVNLFVLNQYLDQEGNPVPQVNPVLIFSADFDPTAARGSNVPPFNTWGQDAFPQVIPACISVAKGPDSFLLGAQGAAGTFVQQMDKFPQQVGNHGQPWGMLKLDAGDAGFVTGIATHKGTFALVLTTQSQGQPPQYSVLFFAAIPNFESGPAQPTQVITGPDTLLNRPQRIAFGPDGSLFVTNWGDRQGEGSVTVYSPDANGMNYRLAHRIGGPASNNAKLSQPTGIAVGEEGTIYVADVSQIKVFEANADGDAQPKQIVDMNRGLQMQLGALLTGIAFRGVFR